MMERIALAAPPVRRLAAGAPHPWKPEAADDLRLARIAHVDHRQNVIREIGKMDRGIGVTATGVPDPMRPEAIDRHEADLGRLVGLGDVVDPDAGRESVVILQLVRGRAAEIGLLVLEFLHGPDTGRVDRQQKIVVSLQVKGARAGGTSDEIEHPRVCRIAHVQGGDAVAEPVPDIGVAAMHHDLHPVAAAAKVRMADELDVAGCSGIHVTHSSLRRRYAAGVGSSPPPRNNCPMRGSARIFSARS